MELANTLDFRHPDFKWEEVQRSFECSEPEPDEVLWATYDYVCYEGEAEIIYRNGEKYYWVSGSHCSCYGLEGQWKPEEYDKQLLIKVLERYSPFRFKRDLGMRSYLLGKLVNR